LIFMAFLRLSARSLAGRAFASLAVQQLQGQPYLG
jgi:hypothetical protein